MPDHSPAAVAVPAVPGPMVGAVENEAEDTSGESGKVGDAVAQDTSGEGALADDSSDPRESDWVPQPGQPGRISMAALGALGAKLASARGQQHDDSEDTSSFDNERKEEGTGASSTTRLSTKLREEARSSRSGPIENEALDSFFKQHGLEAYAPALRRHRLEVVFAMEEEDLMDLCVEARIMKADRRIFLAAVASCAQKPWLTTMTENMFDMVSCGWSSRSARI